MQFLVNRQIAVEAETPEQALEKTKPSEGSTISFHVNPRPSQVAGRVMGNSPQAQPNVTIMPQPTETTVFQHPG